MGKVEKELINSVATVVPTKGTNAGKQMFVINGKHWSKQEPKDSDTHVVLEEVDGEGEHQGKKFLNVTGFGRDTRMSLSDKIGLLSANPEIAGALATLLK